MTDHMKETERLLAEHEQAAGLCSYTDCQTTRAALLAHIQGLHALCEESRTVVRGLLNALPSATTHPAISAARKLIYKLEDEQ